MNYFKIRRQYASDILDISLLLLSIWWLIVLFSPMGTFETSIYELIDETGGLFVWRTATVILNALYITALLLDKHTLKAAAAIATIGALIFMVVALYRIEPYAAAIGPYFIFLLIAFWRYLNIMRTKL